MRPHCAAEQELRRPPNGRTARSYASCEPYALTGSIEPTAMLNFRALVSITPAEK